ncbi:MAG: ribosomal protein S18-alanine N-acetyltransferase [Gammaproteobacteria bacterium]
MSARLKDQVEEFRPMCDADIGEITAIELSAYTHPWTANLFGDCLRAGYNCWVLQLNGAIISYGIVAIGAGECHILNLCVKPELQNNGYGMAMLEYLLDLARHHHTDTAFLEVRPSNHAAIRLYEKAGFNEVGMRSNYYPAFVGREDAIILARSLI